MLNAIDRCHWIFAMLGDGGVGEGSELRLKKWFSSRYDIEHNARMIWMAFKVQFAIQIRLATSFLANQPFLTNKYFTKMCNSREFVIVFDCRQCFLTGHLMLWKRAFNLSAHCPMVKRCCYAALSIQMPLDFIKHQQWFFLYPKWTCYESKAA